jgi:adenylate cyclase
VVEKVQRRLAAIIAADVVGYSRLMGQDEAGTLAQLKTIRREIVHPAVSRHRGTVVNTTGDGWLVEFPSAVEAVEFAVAVQREMADGMAERPADRRLDLRIGINVGDVIVEDDGDIYGDGVNVAARIEGLADPGGICISRTVRDQIRDKLPYQLEDRGEHQVKNIARPVRVFAVTVGSAATSSRWRPEGVLNDGIALPDKPSIAILPFANIGNDPEQEFFADGLTEDIITALSRVSGLFVIARNSSFTYKGRAVDVKQVGRELGVRYVLEGSVRRAGTRVRVTGQLLDASTGNHVWAEKYDRELADVFQLQDEITQNVAAFVHTQVALREGERAERSSTRDIVEWELTQRGLRKIYELTLSSAAEAIVLAERAVQLFPRSAKAHLLLAMGHYHRTIFRGGDDTEAAFREAVELCRRAIELDDNDEYAHWMLGNALMMAGEYETSIAAQRRALEINPNFSLAYGSLGAALNCVGDYDEAIRNCEIALRANPRDPSNFFRYIAIAYAHFLRGGFRDAVDWAKRAVDRKPDYHSTYLILAASLAASDRLSEAARAIEQCRARAPQISIARVRKGLLQNSPDIEKLVEALRRAGLPEQ